MPHQADRWSRRYRRWLQPGLVTFGMFWGLTPPYEWFTEEEPCPPQHPERSGRSPGPSHPERRVPHVPPSPVEQALWSQLASDAPTVPESGHADRLP
jgi:hypothetical protein